MTDNTMREGKLYATAQPHRLKQTELRVSNNSVGWIGCHDDSVRVPTADLATLREKAAEADELRECKALLSEARKSMRQYEADCDEYPPFHHNKLMERIDAAIAQERQP